MMPKLLWPQRSTKHSCSSLDHCWNPIESSPGSQTYNARKRGAFPEKKTHHLEAKDIQLSFVMPYRRKILYAALQKNSGIQTRPLGKSESWRLLRSPLLWIQSPAFSSACTSLHHSFVHLIEMVLVKVEDWILKAPIFQDHLYFSWNFWDQISTIPFKLVLCTPASHWTSASKLQNAWGFPFLLQLWINHATALQVDWQGVELI